MGNEREDPGRWSGFLAVLRRSWGHYPRGYLEAWAGEQFKFLQRGSRGLRVSDEALGAWIRSASPARQVQEARALWGHGWIRGVEVRKYR